MPEPFKNLYSNVLIAKIALQVNRQYKNFDQKGFKKSVLCADWESKELKDRMSHIAECLHEFLPKNYSWAIKILKSVTTHFDGLQAMVFPAYVELYGVNMVDEYETSISALEHFTQYSTAEFAVRPFIERYPKKMMAQMFRWASSENYHVRRLASEGCRPRLPWARALIEFKLDPTPIIKILKKLKNDESEYVRRSVANNLNDISKDHPAIVLELVRSWIGKHSQTDRLLKHACRSLLKAGEPKALRLFGFKKPSHIVLEKFKLQKKVTMGEKILFEFTLKAKHKKLGQLRLEYAIDFLKSNGKRSRKVFKISEINSKDVNRKFSKQHSFKMITTRKYYRGKHGLSVIINGHELSQGEFVLT